MNDQNLKPIRSERKRPPWRHCQRGSPQTQGQLAGGYPDRTDGAGHKHVQRAYPRHHTTRRGRRRTGKEGSGRRLEGHCPFAQAGRATQGRPGRGRSLTHLTHRDSPFYNAAFSTGRACHYPAVPAYPVWPQSTPETGRGHRPLDPRQNHQPHKSYKA